MATMLSEGGVERSARRTGGAGRRRERRPGGPAAWAVAAVVSDLERPRGPPVTCAQQLPRSTGRQLTAECPCECPLPEISFPGRRREARSVLGAVRGLSLPLPPHQNPKKNLRAE